LGTVTCALQKPKEAISKNAKVIFFMS